MSTEVERKAKYVPAMWLDKERLEHILSYQMGFANMGKFTKKTFRCCYYRHYEL